MAERAPWILQQRQTAERAPRILQQEHKMVGTAHHNLQQEQEIPGRAPQIPSRFTVLIVMMTVVLA